MDAAASESEWRDATWATADELLATIDELIHTPVTDSSHPRGAAPARPPRRTVPTPICFACHKAITGELWVMPEHKANQRTVTLGDEEVDVWDWEPTYFCAECAHIPIPSKHGGTRTIATGGRGAHCEWCGRIFHARAHWRIYCTPACRQAFASRSYYEQHRQVLPTEHACEVCGRSFTARAGAKTCSSACRQKAYRQRGGQ
jgi:hypothetical protein